MPMTYKIWPEYSLIIARPLGKLTEKCTLDYFKAVRSDPDWRPGMNKLIDNKDMIDVAMTYSEMRNVRANETVPVEGHNPQPISVFVCTTDLGYGMARMYQAIEKTPPVDRVFIVETYDEAFQILGIPVEKRAQMLAE